MLAIGHPNDMTEDDFYEYIDKNVPKPWGITPKIDGIRCVTRDVGVETDAFCRSLKPVPNYHVREMVRKLGPNWDGELTCGPNFQSVTSGIMSHDFKPDFTYFIFDHIPRDPRMTYRQRVEQVLMNIRSKFCRPLYPREVTSIPDVIQWKLNYVNEGAEGAILRPMDSPYKWGRSTLKEGWMIKLKDFTDAEAVVIGYNEEMHNSNESVQSELDYKVRPTNAAGMVGKGRLGSLRVRDAEGREFNVGTGFNAFQREYIWRDQSEYMGRTIKFKYQAHGTKDAPRIPVCLGFRDKEDV